jgi:hypothetical protein
MMAAAVMNLLGRRLSGLQSFYLAFEFGSAVDELILVAGHVQCVICTNWVMLFMDLQESINVAPLRPPGVDYRKRNLQEI